MEAEHDSHIAGHFGTYKTIEIVWANFLWSKIDEHITEYIRTSDIYKRSKTIRHRKFWVLEPIDIQMRHRNAISMDFIMGIPELQEYTKICIIDDRFSKMVYFISPTTEVLIKKLALIFLQNIWHLNGLPESIIFDQDTPFTSKFWMKLTELLSTACHNKHDYYISS